LLLLLVGGTEIDPCFHSFLSRRIQRRQPTCLDRYSFFYCPGWTLDRNFARRRRSPNKTEKEKNNNITHQADSKDGAVDLN